MRMMGAMKAKFSICTAIATILLKTGTAPLVSEAPTACGQASLQPDVEAISLDLAVRDRHNRPDSRSEAAGAHDCRQWHAGQTGQSAAGESRAAG
jgi:hypothetical protein